MNKRIDPFENVQRNRLAQVFAERIVAGCEWNQIDTKESAERVAKTAYQLADAVIAEGAK